MTLRALFTLSFACMIFAAAIRPVLAQPLDAQPNTSASLPWLTPKRPAAPKTPPAPATPLTPAAPEVRKILIEPSSPARFEGGAKIITIAPPKNETPTPLGDADTHSEAPTPLSIKKEPTGAADVMADAPPADLSKNMNAVALMGLNKVTAHSKSLNAAVGTMQRYGNLEIITHRCRQQDTPRPQAKALLEIWEMRSNEGPKKIFQGWMFSTSASLSNLEHPVYDIALKSCVQMDLSGQ